MLKVLIPDSIEKINKQIAALEYAIKNDTRKKDIEIHTQALNVLKEGLKALEEVQNTPSAAGRPKTAPVDKINELREQGKTQEAIARELNISLSTVRRNLKL